MATNRSAIRRLSLAMFISVIWGEAAYVALAFGLYRQMGSGLWVAAVFLLTMGVPGFFTPIGGVIADRFDRRRVMVTADALAAAAFVVLVFYAGTEQPRRHRSDRGSGRRSAHPETGFAGVTPSVRGSISRRSQSLPGRE
jgi:MFS family permease